MTVRGRPRKPVSTLALHGTYRKDRHGDRAEPAVGGEPVKPNDLSDDASRFWDSVIPELVQSGVVKHLDSAIAIQAARLWGYLCEAQREAESDPLGKDVRIAVATYYTLWERAAGKLGLTPQDRARISVQQPKDKPGRVASRARGA